jgi:predicted RNase H-like HicB family nuclease
LGTFAISAGFSYDLYMVPYRYIPLKRKTVKTYIFPAEVEQQDDGRWSAWIEALPGCAVLGYTKEEALRNIHSAADAYVRDMEKAGEALNQGAPVHIIDEPVVAVTL